MSYFEAGSFAFKAYTTRLAAKSFIFLGVILSLIYYFERHAQNTHTYWLLLALLSFSLITTETGFWRQQFKILCTGVVTTLSVFLVEVQNPILILMAIYLVIIVTLSFWLYQTKKQDLVPILIVNLFTDIAAYHHASFIENVYASFYILLGCVLVLIAQFIFLPYYWRDRFHAYYVDALIALAQLNQTIFNCLTQTTYSANEYYYERAIHLAKTQCLQALAKLRHIQMQHPRKNQSQLALLTELDQLYALMLNYAQLRWRIKDHAVFEVSALEMTAIAAQINYLLSRLLTHEPDEKLQAALTNFDYKVERLEDIYNNVLLVAAREPLAFILFLNGIKAMRPTIENLNTTLVAS